MIRIGEMAKLIDVMEQRKTLDSGTVATASPHTSQSPVIRPRDERSSAIACQPANHQDHDGTTQGMREWKEEPEEPRPIN